MLQLSSVDDYIQWLHNPITQNFLAAVEETKQALFEQQFYSKDDERSRLSHQAQGVQEVFNLITKLTNPEREKE